MISRKARQGNRRAGFVPRLKKDAKPKDVEGWLKTKTPIPFANLLESDTGDTGRGVCVVFTPSRFFYRTASVHPVSVLIPYPREMQIMRLQTVRQEQIDRK